MENEPHLIGRRAVARHAVGGELRPMQLDQVLHLPVLAVDVFVEVLRRAVERGDDIADVDPEIRLRESVGIAKRAAPSSFLCATSGKAYGGPGHGWGLTTAR